MTTWVVQSNLGSNEDIQSIGQACVSLGHGFYPIKAIPFDTEPPNIPVFPDSVVLYGATGFVNTCLKADKWSPGAWYEEDTFSATSYLDKYDCLNSDAEVTTIEEFSTSDRDPNEDFFVRPVRDLKEFAGSVVEFGEFREWYDVISHGGFTVSKDCPILVSSPKNMHDEYRLFFVDGDIVAGSRYRNRGRLRPDPFLPHDIMVFGHEQSRIWQPAPIFCMDVSAREGPGPSGFQDIKVVEIGCFNSCGFYSADISEIVRHVSDYVYF